MTLVTDLVRRTAEHLRAERGIDAGLDKVAEDAEAATDLEVEATSVRRALRKRAAALEEAQAELLNLTRQVAHLKSILPFKEECWPNRLNRLRKLAADDTTGALKAWLQYWFEAIGSYRLDASGRLVREAPLPEGCGLISERAMVAAVGLERRDWDLVAPMLSAGADGIQVGSDTVPTPEVRTTLQRLLARLALAAGRLDDADRLLRGGRAGEGTAASLALQARQQRLAGDMDRARSLALQAQSANPGDLDVVAELVCQGRKTTEIEAVLEIARVGIDALPSLLDVDSDLGRLLEPPAELWIALSDRARREAMPDLVMGALDAAEGLAGWDDYGLRAAITERRAEAATSITERVRAWRDAGDQRQAANDLKRARVNFNRAAEVSPEDVDPQLWASAVFRYADTVAVLDAPQPLRLVRDEVADALQRLLDAQAIDGMAAAESWSYLTEVELRANLARGADLEASDQAWRAFLAAARAVALYPDEARRWSTLASAAQLLTCYRTAEAAARHAWERGGAAEVPAYIQALANMGRLDQAIKLIDATDPWSECVRAYILLRLGKYEDVIRLLRAVTVDPSWTWAQQTLITALVLTERFGEAEAEAAGFASIISERIDEANSLFTMAFYEQVQGRLDRAVELAESALAAEQGFGEGDAATLLGESLLLRGDREGGLRLLGQAVSSYSNRMLEDWSRVERPTLEALARRQGAEPGDLKALEAMLDRRHEEIAAISDPLAELAQALKGAADESVVRSAQALGAVLLHLAAGDEAPAREALAEVGTGFEDEVSSLHGHLRRLADERRHAELAAHAVQLSSQGDRMAASNVLAQLLDEVPYDTDSLLRRQGTAEELRPVGEVLAELATNPQYEGPATNVLHWLDMAQPEPEAPSIADLRLELPSSWFADYDDPVHQHLLFLRYLPELRARVDWQIPAVHVLVEDVLEPDRYRIWTGEELLDEGRVQPEARYCSDATLEFLSDGLRAVATSDPHLALSWFPAAAVEQGSVADLVTMPSIEVVARLVGDAAKRLAEQRTQ
jgi:hypothetical protein